MWNIIGNINSIPKHFNLNTVGTGTVAAIMACTGPMLIVITAAQSANLSSEQTISWLFGIYFFGGLLGIILPLLTGMPIPGAYSIPGAVLLSQALSQFNFAEAIGAYIIAGLIVVSVGYFGWFQRLLIWLPDELVMAMLAGSMLHFATDIIKAVNALPLIGGLTLLTYFFFTKYFTKVPPILGAIGAVIILYLSFGHPSTVPELSFQFPSLWLPEFSFGSVLAISIPISIMMLGNEGAQGISVLRSAGYKPPVNLITMVNGFSTMLAAIFGAHSIGVAAIMTALCSSKEAGEKDGRYVAALVSGLWMCIFGLFASIALTLIFLIPLELIKLIAGLALIKVLLGSLQKSFNGTQFQLGAFFTLAIALSGLNFYGISSTFWALVGGWLISWFFEQGDFKKRFLSSSVSQSSSLKNGSVE